MQIGLFIGPYRLKKLELTKLSSVLALM